MLSLWPAGLSINPTYRPQALVVIRLIGDFFYQLGVLHQAGWAHHEHGAGQHPQLFDTDPISHAERSIAIIRKGFTLSTSAAPHHRFWAKGRSTPMVSKAMSGLSLSTRNNW